MTAQITYYPKGTTWTVSYCGYLHGTGIDRICTVGEDTIINNKTYRVVKTSYPESHNPNYVQAECAIREEGSMVYAYFFDLNEEYPYYNFDWNSQKDIALVTLSHDGPVYSAIAETENVELCNGSICEQTTIEPWHVTIVNGIGKVNVYGGVFPKEILEPDNGNTYFISRFIRDGEELYTKAATSVLSVRVECSPSILYDLQGRRLDGMPQRGVYIRDGRKVVVK